MNICLVIISDGWGGAENVVYKLAYYLRDKGNQVSLILNQEVLKYYADLEGVKIFNIGCMSNPLALARSIVLPHSGLKERPYPRNRVLGLASACLTEFLYWVYYQRIRGEIQQFLLDNHVDIIQAHLIRAIALTCNLGNLGLPIVVSPGGGHGLRRVTPAHPLSAPLVKWQARQFRRALNKADRVREGSNFMKDVWEDFGIPLKNKFIAIPNGYNLSEVQGISASTLKLKGKFNLLFPGGAKWVKGGDLLIPALAKVRQEIPDIHLYIALDVPQEHLLRRMVNDLGLESNVTFTGFLPGEEFQKMLNSVDLLVMPSRIEASPVVFVEAMALGKPIIAGNTGGIPEVVKHGRNGILVEPEPDQIAMAILDLYQNADKRNRMSQNNQHDAARFDWNIIADQYITLYRELSANSS